MKASRLEAFSDGVIAIIITIMVLEIHPPHEGTLEAWLPVVPTLLAYVLSFVVLAIYWNNHHHLLRAVKNVSPGVMWANMYLLFWLSTIPVATAWMGQHYLETWPVVVYSFIGLMAGTAYYALTRFIIAANPDTGIKEAIGKDKKGIISQILYVAALLLAFVHPYIAYTLLAITALMWFIPDRRLASV
ncbi:TMEM175 family protein [Patescibacteria group bacterium]|nr:TMEM175 family protein [Patescibacteria group bacterium]